MRADPFRRGGDSRIITKLRLNGKLLSSTSAG
jgi:hypothetical protein